MKLLGEEEWNQVKRAGKTQICITHMSTTAQCVLNISANHHTTAHAKKDQCTEKKYD